MGERTISLDEECVADLADSLERSRPGRCVKTYVNEIGPGCRFAPEGSRLLVVVKGPPRKTVAENRSALAMAVRKLTGKSARVHTRPLGTIRAPPVDEFASRLFRKTTLRNITD